MILYWITHSSTLLIVFAFLILWIGHSLVAHFDWTKAKKIQSVPDQICDSCHQVINMNKNVQ